MLILFKNDLAYLKKDPMTILCLGIPIIILIAYRFVLVHMAFLEPFLPYMRYLFVSMIGITSGMGVGFRVLDDKDEHMLTFYAVTPLGIRGYLSYRLLISLGISFLGGSLLVSGLELGIPWGAKLAILVQLILLTSLSMGILTSICQNKIQGLTFMKFSSLILLVPFLHLLGTEGMTKWLVLMPTHMLYEIIVEKQFLGVVYAWTLCILMGANIWLYKQDIR